MEVREEEEEYCRCGGNNEQVSWGVWKVEEGGRGEGWKGGIEVGNVEGGEEGKR